MGVLDGTEIILDGEVYKLLREPLATRLSRRRWSVQRKRLATQRTPRPDVRPGEVEGDYVVTWSDWSKGIQGDRENLVGCLHFAEGAHGLIPGVLRPAWTESYEGFVQTTDQEARPCRVLEMVELSPSYITTAWLFMGRYVYACYDNNIFLDTDLGAGSASTDATIAHNEIFITTGAGMIRRRQIGGIYTTGNYSRDFFAGVLDRVWGSSQHQVANSLASADLSQSANWSANIAIGQDWEAPIMALTIYGERVAACAPSGIYMGDRAALFPNVMPRPFGEWDEGKRSVARGPQIFYPHRGGLLVYDGASIEEVGPGQHFLSANLADQLPGMIIRALCTDGNLIYAVTQPAGYPEALPTGFLMTQDNGATYTNGTAAVTDNDLGTGLYSQISTLANGDYLLVGYNQPFYGIKFLMNIHNVSPGTITAAYVTAAGPPVVATVLPAASSFDDGTRNRDQPGDGNTSFNYGGILSWTDRTPTDLPGWAPVTVGGITAYWIRLSIAVNQINVVEARVATTKPRAHVLRGRPWRPGDVRHTSIIWEPYTVLDGATFPSAIGVVSAGAAALSPSGHIIVLNKQRVFILRKDFAALDPGMMDYPGGGRVYSAKHDGGSAETDKAFNSVRLKGRLDATHTVAFEYRVDDSSTWIMAEPSADTSPFEIALPVGTAGRTFQWRLTFNAFRSREPTEIYEIELGYRELAEWRDEGTYLLELYDNGSTSDGAALPDSDVQLTRLEALHDGAAGSVILRDATQRLQTVTVQSVRQQEVFQEALDYPVLAVEVVCAEV